MAGFRRTPDKALQGFFTKDDQVAQHTIAILGS